MSGFRCQARHCKSSIDLPETLNSCLGWKRLASILFVRICGLRPDNVGPDRAAMTISTAPSMQITVLIWNTRRHFCAVLAGWC